MRWIKAFQLFLWSSCLLRTSFRWKKKTTHTHTHTMHMYRFKVYIHIVENNPEDEKSLRFPLSLSIIIAIPGDMFYFFIQACLYKFEMLPNTIYWNFKINFWYFLSTKLVNVMCVVRIQSQFLPLVWSLHYAGTSCFCKWLSHSVLFINNYITNQGIYK